jgi:hypothetical protein
MDLESHEASTAAATRMELHHAPLLPHLERMSGPRAVCDAGVTDQGRLRTCWSAVSKPDRFHSKIRNQQSDVQPPFSLNFQSIPLILEEI